MAIIVQVSGLPGTGKTRAIKGLVEKYPGQIYCINADRKPLSWAGWRKEFNKENKNYFETSDPEEVMNILRAISSQRPDIKAVIVDTISTIMSDKEVDDMRRPGFDETCRIKISLIAGISLRLIYYNVTMKYE